MASQIWPAIIAAVVSLLVAGSSALLTKSKLRWDSQLQMESLKAQARQQEARLRTELKTEFMAEDALHQLLEHETWEQRSFAQIKKRIRGFDDNELRRLLVRSGAVAFQRDSAEEFWGLRTRNADKLNDQ